MTRCIQLVCISTVYAPTTHLKDEGGSGRALVSPEHDERCDVADEADDTED